MMVNYGGRVKRGICVVTVDTLESIGDDQNRNLSIRGKRDVQTCFVVRQNMFSSRNKWFARDITVETLFGRSVNYDFRGLTWFRLCEEFMAAGKKKNKKKQTRHRAVKCSRR